MTGVMMRIINSTLKVCYFDKSIVLWYDVNVHENY